MRIPKKVIRALTADESMERYFRIQRAEMNMEIQRRLSVLEVHRVDGNTLHVMQIIRIYTSDQGVVVEVR